MNNVSDIECVCNKKKKKKLQWFLSVTHAELIPASSCGLDGSDRSAERTPLENTP